MKIGAAILAGGQARRMNGIAKGNIKIDDNQSIITKLVAEFKKIALTEIVISANNQTPYLQYRIPIIADNELNQGPLAGVISVLRYFSAREYGKVIFLPCDLPNITSNELSILKNSSSDAIVYAKIEEQYHPLCVSIPTNQLPAITLLFVNGERKIIKVWQQLGGTALKFKDNNSFININTNHELSNYLRALN